MASRISVAQHRQQLLDKLTAAGSAGLTRSALRLTSALRRQALQELERERLIGNLGSARAPRYVVAAHFNPLERAYRIILQRGRPGQLRLLTKKQLFEETPKLTSGAIWNKREEALTLLLEEGEILAARRGANVLYFHRVGLPEALRQPGSAPRLAMEAPLPTPPEVPAGPPPAWERIRAAYLKAVAEEGFGDVHIATLQRHLGGALAPLQEALVAACRAGQANASLGDESLATPAQRDAGIVVGGRRHLRIRLKG